MKYKIAPKIIVFFIPNKKYKCGKIKFPIKIPIKKPKTDENTYFIVISLLYIFKYDPTYT